MNLTAQYVNQPTKPEGKYGNIKTPEDKTYWVKKEMLGRFVKGQSYDVKVEPQTWGDKNVEVITAITAVAVTPISNGPSSDRWFMPFVSNTVAHAIAAGKIQEPLDIKAWAAAAKQAAEEL